MKAYALWFRNRDYVLSLAVALLFLMASLVVNFYAGTYAQEKASNAVTDIILDNIPVFDVDGTFVYGAIGLFAFLMLYLLTRPQQIPFTFKCLSVFIFIRSVFISITHLAPFPTHIIIEYAALNKLTFGGDLFFSGHTGLPFLLALIFWDHRLIRYIFLASSVVFAVVVLMGHLHYSIDVRGAYFITFTIFHLCEKFFKKDLAIFKAA